MILVKNVTLFVLGQNRPRKVFRDVLSLFQTINISRSNFSHCFVLGNSHV